MNVGDAVLGFTADTTQLDQAFDRIQSEGPQALAPVQAAAEATSAAMDGVGVSAAEAGTAMKGAAAEGEAAGSQISASWLKVAQATAENQQAQQSLRAALSNVRQTAGQSTESISLLAAAQERASIASQNLAKAQEEARQEALALSGAVKQAGDSALVMGEEFQVAGTEAAFSMGEAKGSLALISEEAGVNIPRHLRGFIAELPGVGAALNAAFSAIAILVLVQIIVEATEKLTEFVSEIFIYTEAMKEAAKAQVELNTAMLEHSKTIKELKEAYELLGLNGARKTRQEFEQLRAEWDKQNAALRDAKDTVYLYEKGIGDLTATQYEAAKAQKALLGSAELGVGVLGELAQKMAALQKNFELETKAEIEARGKSQLDAEKTIADATINLLQAQSRVRLAQTNASYSEQLESQRKFNEDRYQEELKHQKRVLENLKSDPIKNENAIREQNARIEAIQKDHDAKLLNDATEATKKAVAILQGIKAQFEKTPLVPVDAVIPLSELGQAFKDLQDIGDQFGIKTTAMWHQETAASDQALEKLKTNTNAFRADILLLENVSAHAHLGLAISEQDQSSVTKYAAEIKKLHDEMVKLGLVTDKYKKSQQSVNGLLDEFRKHSIEQRDDLTKTQAVFNAVISDVSDAFGSAITQWINGQKSLGEALKEALAQYLAQLAGKAAADAMYFTAWGIADLFWDTDRAAGDFAAAAEFAALAVGAGVTARALGAGSKQGGDGAPGNSSPIATQGAASQGDATPAQTTNVQHFAGGALFTGRTMAMLGDSMTGGDNVETAMPLEGPVADDVASRIASKIKLPTPKVVIKGKSIGHLIKEINHSVESGHKLISSVTRDVKRKS